MLWIATTLLALAPQGTVIRDREGRIILPPVQRAAQQQKPQKPAVRDGVQRRFHERALELRRSRHLSEVSEQDLLRKIGADFEDAAARSLKLARSADYDLLHGLMRVLRTYGGPAEAEELKFLLQTQPFGKATRVAMQTLAVIGRDKSRDLLFDCLTASRDNVRRFAAVELETLVRPEDFSRLATIAGQGRADLRVRATRLIGKLRSPEVTAHLVAALRDDTSVAEAACRGLIGIGEAAVPALQEVVSQRATGRSFGFAAFALASLEEAGGRPLFKDEMRPHLLAELDMPDPFMRTVSAIALSGMAWRSSDTTGQEYSDHAIVDGLVAVVAPREFVPHVSLIQDLARRRLTRFSGMDFALQHSRWRDWWDSIKADEAYVASRRRLDIAGADAKLAVLTWRDGKQVIRFRGEDSEALPPSPDPQIEFLIAPDEFVALVGRLERVGFMREPRTRSVTPIARSLRLTVGSARCQTDARLNAAAADALARVVHEAADERSWQLYRDPEREPDAAAFWRSERRWLANHSEPRERAERLVGRIIARLPSLSGKRVDFALAHLASVKQLREVLDRDHANGLLEALRARSAWDGRAARMADFVLAAGDAAPWRELLDVAVERAGDDSAVVLSQLFGLLGSDRVVEATRSGSRAVRLAAMDEVVKLKDQRAVSNLVELLSDKDNAVRTTAAFSLGKLRAAEGRQPLLDLLVHAGDEISPHLRRITWVALARIGGDEVFPILSAAFYSPVDEDRRAVLQALAELRHAGATAQLANVFALRGPDDDLGFMALRLLRGLGDLQASPVLRSLLENPSAAVRHEAAIALAEFGDPASLPFLIDRLDQSENPLQLIALIAGLTGVDVTERDDRVQFLRRWAKAHADVDQGEWLIDALTTRGISHSLKPGLLLRGSGPVQVAELCRLLVEAEPPYLKPLVAKVLRRTTGEEFGVVTVETENVAVQAIAERYRFLGDSDKAASGR